MELTPNVQPGDQTVPGETYRIRLQLYGPYDVQHVNTISNTIRTSAAIQPWWKIEDVEAVSDDTVSGIVPYASQVSENYSIYVTATRVGSTASQAPSIRGEHGVVPIAFLTVAAAVALILALLTGFVVVLGWQAEKISAVGKATIFNPLFLAAAVLIVFLIVKGGRP